MLQLVLVGIVAGMYLYTSLRQDLKTLTYIKMEKMSLYLKTLCSFSDQKIRRKEVKEKRNK